MNLNTINYVIRTVKQSILESSQPNLNINLKVNGADLVIKALNCDIKDSFTINIKHKESLVTSHSNICINDNELYNFLFKFLTK